MMRLDANDFARIYIFLPYFMRKIKDGYKQAPTVAVKWAETMLKDKNLSEAKVTDLRTIKQNYDGNVDNIFK